MVPLRWSIIIFDDPVQSMDEDHYKTFASGVIKDLTLASKLLFLHVVTNSHVRLVLLIGIMITTQQCKFVI